MDLSIPPELDSRRRPVAYEFGAFRLEPAEQRLLYGGEAIPLPHRAFDMLVYLVERSGHLVSKEELLEALWPGVFVEESNLSQNVFLLRRALTNGAPGREYIETVPRRGYRFTAPVREILAEPPAVEEVSPVRSETAPSGDRPRSRRLLAVAAVLLAAAAGVALWRRRYPAPPIAGVRSIAVLPLKNLDAAGIEDPLGLGIAEAVVSRLSRARSLVVRPLSSTRREAAASPDGAATGARLRVDAVLEGTLQRSDRRVRATTELVRVSDGRVLWSDAFEEPESETFRLEDSVAERLASALGREIGLAKSRDGNRPATSNPRAHEAYLRGRLFWNRRMASDLNRAVEELNVAVSEDPAYALAWSGLADAYVLLGPSSEGAFARARQSAERALALDPDLAEAHASLGFTEFFSDWNFEGADRELREALRLDPGYATAHQWYGYWLAAAGRPDAAVAEMQRAMEIDPLSMVLAVDIGHILIYGERFEESAARLRHVMDVDPNFHAARVYLVYALVFAGRYDEAAAELRRLDDWPDGLNARSISAWLEARRGRADEARALVPRLVEAAAAGEVGPDAVAGLYGALGDRDEAFAWLERALRQRRFYLVFLKTDPLFAPLRSDPRFTALVRRVGIPG